MSFKQVMKVLSTLINMLLENGFLTLNQFNKLVKLQTSEKTKKTRWKKNEN